jgi:hypothetical protein
MLFTKGKATKAKAYKSIAIAIKRAYDVRDANKPDAMFPIKPAKERRANRS